MNNMAQRFTVISLGGSIVIPKSGFDPDFLRSFRKFILKRVKKGEQFILVVGGGTTARNYIGGLEQTLPKVTDADRDWVGIYATWLNARFVHKLFADIAYKEIMIDPRENVKTNKPMIIAGGWKPGWSTDYVATLHAKRVGATHVLNLSNIEYAYDKDPNVHADAQKIERIDWKNFRKIVGNTWKAGTSAPFDPIASKEAEKLGLKVSLVKGTDLKEVGKAIDGKTFRGTIIEPS